MTPEQEAKLSELLNQAEAIMPGLKARLIVDSLDKTYTQAVIDWTNSFWIPIWRVNLSRRNKCRFCHQEMTKGTPVMSIYLNNKGYHEHRECFVKHMALLPIVDEIGKV